MDTNRKNQRTTQRQLQFYLQFCKQHPELQAGKNNPREPRLLQSLWSELAEKLNGMRGPTRTPKKWRYSLSQWKNQLRCRARKEKEVPLTDIEQQALATLGASAVEGVTNESSLAFQPHYENVASPSSRSESVPTPTDCAEMVASPADCTENAASPAGCLENVVSPAGCSESDASPDSFSESVASPARRKRVTLQLFYEELKKASLREEMQERLLLEQQAKRRVLMERSIALQQQMVQQQKETTAALKHMGDAILTLARIFGNTNK